MLFSAPMVRAILAGQKTQTRRLVTPRPPELTAEQVRRGQSYGLCPAPAQWGKPRTFIVSGSVQAVREHQPMLANLGIDCRYGAPGDRLWVRETWAPGPSVYPFDPFIYRADVNDVCGDDPATAEHVQSSKGPHSDCYACERERCGFRWRPSIHMPRHASRITLEVTGVRIERLQAISEHDARAEGVKPSDASIVFDDKGKIRAELSNTHRGAFACLWDAINGKLAPWASNPWAWAIDFKRVRP
jgi:hypothetical protein